MTISRLGPHSFQKLGRVEGELVQILLLLAFS